MWLHDEDVSRNGSSNVDSQQVCTICVYSLCSKSQPFRADSDTGWAMCLMTAALFERLKSWALMVSLLRVAFYLQHNVCSSSIWHIKGYRVGCKQFTRVCWEEQIARDMIFNSCVVFTSFWSIFSFVVLCRASFHFWYLKPKLLP